jgi:hypothetical protein
MNEIWKPVVGYEGVYEVSNLGRVRSLDRIVSNGRKKGRVLRLAPLSHSGHLTVGLHWNGQQKTQMVHRLVLESFVGPCPPGMETCHFPDRSPANNRLDNLRWDTNAANKADMAIHGTKHFPRGEKNAGAKLTADQVVRIRDLARTQKQKDIAKLFGVGPGRISTIVSGRGWKHLTNPAQIGSGNTTIQ